MEDILINFGVSAVLAAIKNPVKRERLRKTFLKVFNAIKAAYAGDPDFE
jgi:hypothetical protein